MQKYLYEILNLKKTFSILDPRTKLRFILIKRYSISNY